MGCGNRLLDFYDKYIAVAETKFFDIHDRLRKYVAIRTDIADFKQKIVYRFPTHRWKTRKSPGRIYRNFPKNLSVQFCGFLYRK